MNRGDRLRVLVVAPWAPWPLSHGGKLRLHHLLRGVARRDDVTLVIPSAGDDVGELGDLRELVTIETMRARPCGATKQQSEPTPTAAEQSPAKPRLVSRLVRRHFGYDDAIDAWLRCNATRARFDVALCVEPKFGQYVDAIGVPCVWDAVDDLVLYAMREARYAGAARWPAAARAASLYAAYERHVARSAAATVFTSSVDAECARRWVGDGPRIEVVTNGVDLEYFNPDAVNCKSIRAWAQADSLCHTQVVSAARKGSSSVVFVGALDFPPNVDGIVHFARHIWPKLYRQGRQLTIVGRRPTEAVQSLAAIPGVRVVGEVPDVRPWLLHAGVVIVPTRAGGGVKNKVLEACAMGRPVVASPRALGGLSAQAGVDLLCAGSPAEWTNCIRDLLADRARADAIGKAGQRWVRSAHLWSDAADRMRSILADAAIPRSASDEAPAVRRPNPKSKIQNPKSSIAAGGVSCR